VRIHREIALSVLALSAASCSMRSDVIERPDAPESVAGYAAHGLTLADGRVIALPDMATLPASSPVLEPMIERGVDVGPDGRVYGLLPIWHGWGNDPIRRHLARVDVARVLEFAHGRASSGTAFDCAPVSEHGWNVSCWYAYERWLRGRVASHREANDR
jgi:hypothetical protein